MGWNRVSIWQAVRWSQTRILKLSEYDKFWSVDHESNELKPPNHIRSGIRPQKKIYKHIFQGIGTTPEKEFRNRQWGRKGYVSQKLERFRAKIPRAKNRLLFPAEKRIRKEQKPIQAIPYKQYVKTRRPSEVYLYSHQMNPQWDPHSIWVELLNWTHQQDLVAIDN